MPNFDNYPSKNFKMHPNVHNTRAPNYNKDRKPYLDKDNNNTFSIKGYHHRHYVRNSKKDIDKLENKMKDAAKELNFEEAANLRDRIKKLRQKLSRNS